MPNSHSIDNTRDSALQAPDEAQVAKPNAAQPHIEAVRFVIEGSILKYSSYDDVAETLGGIAGSSACRAALAATPDGGWAPVRAERICKFAFGDLVPRAPEGCSIGSTMATRVRGKLVARRWRRWATS